MTGGKSDNSISIATQRQLQQLNSLIQTTFHPRHHETIIEETEEEEETKSSSPKNPIKNEDFILVDLYEIRKEDDNPQNVVEMSSRPVSRLGQPVTSRDPEAQVHDRCPDGARDDRSADIGGASAPESSRHQHAAIAVEKLRRGASQCDERVTLHR